MSEATRKLRSIEAHTTSVCGVRDLIADAIEAVEAQVAEAAKRHEDLAAWCAETEARVAALEKRQGKDGAQVASSGCASVPVAVAPESTASPAAPVRRFKPGDRVRFVKEPRFTGGYLGSFGTVESIVGWPIFFDYDIKSDTCGENGYHVKADDSDLEPAPSAVTAPRGFHEGDICRVIESRRTKNNGLVGCVGALESYPGGSGGDWVINLGDKHGIRCFYNSELTLVRAAAAPEAPAETDLVERLARGEYMHWGGSTTGTMSPRWTGAARGTLSTLRDEGRLCEPGEVTRLTAERDKAREFHDLAEGDLRKWIDRCNERDKDVSDLRAKYLTLEARAEAAEKERDEARAISDSMTARVRSETQIATELRQELDDLRAELDALRFAARTWFNAAGEPELLATAEEVTERRKAAAKELAALRAKPRFRTRKVTAKDVGAWEEEWCKDSYGAGERHKAMNALGFRRRVDGAK